MSSFFGWIPSGNVKNTTMVMGNAFCVTTANPTSEVGIPGSSSQVVLMQSSMLRQEEVISTQPEVTQSEIENLWSLELIGIENPERHWEEERAYELFKSTIFKEPEGRYVVSLPWKDKTTPLPTNYRMVMARLKSVITRSSMEKLWEVDSIIQEQLAEHIVEEAPQVKFRGQPTKSMPVRRIHYLPHRWVQEKTKIRVVYDASAKTNTGHSLNDLVYKGRNLTRVLIGQLVNFRLHEVALSADIKSAYLQIGINEADRDALRFLWVKDLSQGLDAKENLWYLRFARVPFGVNASPFLLNMVLQEHIQKDTTHELSQITKQTFYVDNFLTSVKTPTKALQVYDYMNTKLDEIRMNLRDWATNDHQVFKAIPFNKRHRSVPLEPISVLGLVWDHKQDTLTCKLNTELPSEGTKRNVLHFLASIYDPLNIFAPCLLEFRIFLRECWRNKLDWNTPLRMICYQDGINYGLMPYR